MKKTIPTIIATIALITLMISSVNAQTETTQAMDSATFDFWIGDWNLTWKNADGSVSKGTNKIHRIMDGAIIQENFEATDAGPITGYKGMSVSAFNPRNGEWKQTWVDNQGGYLDFSGAVDGDKRIFHRKGTNSKGETTLQRMVFYNITKDAFDWDWEGSKDDGKTWKLQWRIRYVREGK